jgi:hypothetical protein
VDCPVPTQQWLAGRVPKQEKVSREFSAFYPAHGGLPTENGFPRAFPQSARRLSHGLTTTLGATRRRWSLSDAMVRSLRLGNVRSQLEEVCSQFDYTDVVFFQHHTRVQGAPYLLKKSLFWRFA